MRTSPTIIALVGITVAVAAALVYKPSLPEMTSAATPSDADKVKSGATVFAVGNCAACHTITPDKPLAGGYEMKTGYGSIFTSNISPDPETGIGTWSEAAFVRALRQGVSRDGRHLFPAFPYDHYTRLSDGDASALYAYVMAQPPIKNTPPANTLSAPYSIRALQAGWKLLFFKDARFVPDAAKSTAVNRGAYLVEGLAHCASCHTPRNGLGAEKTSEAFDGALLDGARAHPLNAKNYAPVPWSQDEMASYLRKGRTRWHGEAEGPMGDIVRHGLAPLPDEDIRAIAAYLGAFGLYRNADKAEAAAARAIEIGKADTARMASDDDARLYVAACAACHYNAKDEGKERPELGYRSLLAAPEPDRFIRIVLSGHRADMPAFGKGLSDQDIARIANYLRTTRTPSPPWPEAEKAVRTLRLQGTKS